MEVGLDYRVYEMAIKYGEYEEFYKNLMTKRYTNGRIQRVLTHVLLGIDNKILEKTKNGINYIKILGFSSKGSKYLKEKKEDINIKILPGLKNVKNILNEKEKELLDFEIKCDRIYRITRDYEERKFPIIKKE
jgi:predicted nucleotidyltransferase